MMRTWLLTALVLSAASSWARAAAAPAAPAAAAPAPAASPAPAVKSSTATTAAPSPSTIYTAERLRDPFQRASGGSGGVESKPFTPEDFNIHNLNLRALMKDAAVNYALFSDPAFGVSFILRQGKLYDPKGKPVPGVTGKLDVKLRTAHLMTPDGDVQTFRLGEEEDKEKE